MPSDIIYGRPLTDISTHEIEENYKRLSPFLLFKAGNDISTSKFKKKRLSKISGIRKKDYFKIF